MMKIKIALLFFILSFQCSKGQDVIDTSVLIKFYRTTVDYTSNNITYAAMGEGVTITSNTLKIEEISDLGSRTDMINYNFWAVQVLGKNYFNTTFCHNCHLNAGYLQFDIEGKYCAIKLSKKQFEELSMNSTNFGLGLQGILMSESTKWGNWWPSENRQEYRILLVNTSSFYKNINGRYYSKAQLLSRGLFRKMVKKYDSKINPKTATVEDIFSLLNLLNSK